MTRVTVTYSKQAAEVALPAGATLQQLGAALADKFGVAPHTIKLFMPGAKGAIRLQDQATDALEQAGGFVPACVAVAPAGCCVVHRPCRLPPCPLHACCNHVDLPEHTTF